MAVNAYLLGLAATFALGGRLADVLGPSRMATIGVIGFAGASALCGATPTGSYAEAWIVTLRALQGVVAAGGAPSWPRFAGSSTMLSAERPRPSRTDSFATDHQCDFWSPAGN